MITDPFVAAHADAQLAVRTFLPSLTPPAAPPQAPIQPRKPGPITEAVRALSLARHVERMSARQARGLPPQPPAPPSPQEAFPGSLDAVHVRALQEAIASHPEDQRAALIDEVHQNLVKWIAGKNGKVIVHAKVELAHSPHAAENLAAKIVNQALEEHDQRKQAERESAVMGPERAVDVAPGTLRDSSVVKRDVRRPVGNLKVLRPVVGANSVDVVNDLGRQERSPQLPLGDKSVLKDTLPVDAKGDVSAVQETGPSPDDSAAPGAEAPLPVRDLAGAGAKDGAARLAGTGDSPSQAGGDHGSVSPGGVGAGDASAGAKTLPLLVGNKGRAAQFAGRTIHGANNSTLGTQQTYNDQNPEIVSPGSSSDAAKKGPPAPVTAEQDNRVGKQNADGDLVMQPKNSVEQNQRMAITEAPGLLESLASISSMVQGAKFSRLRPEKSEDRLDDKSEEKSPEAISDYLGAQISADTPQAKDQLLALLRKNFDVLEVDDHFLQGRTDKAGYPSANVQIRLPNSGSAEIQIVPREVQEKTDITHKFYKAGREAKQNGDNDERDRQWAQAAKIHADALDAFNARNADPHAGLRQSLETAGLQPIKLGGKLFYALNSGNASPIRSDVSQGQGSAASGESSEQVTASAPKSESAAVPDGGVAKNPVSDTGATPQDVPRSLSKGQAVTLKTGEKGTVEYSHPSMNVARVRVDGKVRVINPLTDVAG
jgi:hypothetical protein